MPQALLDLAGDALASRYCFAIEAIKAIKEDEVCALITPISYFEANGCCDDQTGPIDHLLPKCGVLSDSAWEVYETGVDTPVEVAKYLQDKGFVWNKDFQDFIYDKQTLAIEKSLEVKVPKISGGSKPKF